MLASRTGRGAPMTESQILISASAAAKIEKSGNDLAHIAQVLSAYRSGRHFPMTLQEARAEARNMFQRNKAIRAVDFVMMRADDSVELVRFGPRGGHKRIAKLFNKHGKAA